MRVKVLQLDVPNANGRIYPTEAIMKAIEAAPDSVLGTIGLAKGTEFDIGEVAFIANKFAIVDGYLTTEVTVLETPAGKIMKNMLEADAVAFRPVGYGNVGEDGTMTDYTLHYISMLPKNDAA